MATTNLKRSGNYVSHKHDKTYRMLLSNQKDAAYIINQVLKLEGKMKIIPEELEKYKSSYVTLGLENREADIVYKLKNKNIFFLIEHQTKIDYAMPFRLQEYELEVQKSAINIKQLKTKKYEIPTVIPIVIYTGKEQWDVRLELNKIKDERFRRVNLSKYNLININECKKEELLQSENFIDKVFLLEKTEAGKEFVHVLKEVIETTKEEEDIKKLSIIIQTTLREKLGKKNVDKLIKQIKGREVTMLGSLSRIIDNERTIGIQQGIKDGIKQRNLEIAKEMKKNNIAIETIEKITGIEKEKIEKIN